MINIGAAEMIHAMADLIDKCENVQLFLVSHCSKCFLDFYCLELIVFK